MTNKNRTISSGRVCRDIFIVGGLSVFSGFLLGLIFAPQSGKKTRALLLKRINEFIERSKFAFVEAKVIAEGLLDKNREDDGSING